MKGGFIPGCSDVDLQLYLDDAAFTSQGHLSMDVGVAIQRDLACIDPAPFLSIQGYPLPPRTPPGWVGPIPGAYVVIAGRLPVPEATEQELQASARTALSHPELTLPYVPDTLLQHGGWELARRVRLVCTAVWPVLYQVLTLQTNDGIRVWGLPKAAAIDLLRPDTSLGQAARAFHQAVLAYYPAAESVAEALRTIERGIAFLQAAQAWWHGAEMGNLRNLGDQSPDLQSGT